LFGCYKIKSVETLVTLGKSKLEEGDFDQALDLFQQAILLDQKDPDLWNLTGITLRSMGRYSEAVECFNKSLSLDPRDKDSS
jgi:Flp pilus assembly protein TadD